MRDWAGGVVEEEVGGEGLVESEHTMYTVQCTAFLRVD